MRRAPVVEEILDGWGEMMSNNLTGVFLCCKRAHSSSTRRY
jgi:hypothetical protein